ncbi:MAG: transglycosylase domain-containing protein [Candidatus Azobacteroides sp.]|nr:transglycosylase domain-containing protein [Candidatus Azobacteroides sp.]
MVKNSFAKRIVQGVWIIFFFCIISAGLIFLLIAKGKIGYMPPVEDLENPINKYASQVLSTDMIPLGAYYQSNENRIYINYNDLSPALVQALIATEDARYYEHSGIDVYALIRSIIKRGILFQKSGGGGSTISQQLAKLLYSEHVGTMWERLFQKPVEWVIAVQLEKYYTKEEIINLYLNKFDFLYNAVGIQSACWVYFNKSPKDISTEEAATLIGMCKNPSYFNPIRQPERTVGRRNVVLSLMEANDYLSKAQCDSLKALPLVTKFNRVEHKDGLAPYFREYLRLTMTAKKPDKSEYPSWNQSKYSEDSLAWETNPLYGWCTKRKKPDGSNFNLYTDGLKIYSTIDSRMQTYAEDAVRERMADLQDAFFKEKVGSKTAPFSRYLDQKDVNEILERAVKQSDRYRLLKKDNKSDSEIQTVFKTPVEMTVFSWKGMKDTIMTPLDSIIYMKSFLRSGFMAMDTRTGAVKAYVGNIDFQYFKYDMVNTGKRQIGSTIKPFLYSLAMESGITPCDEMLHVEQHLVDENGRDYNPRNANKQKIGEMVSIRWGLQQSDNWVSAYLMKQLNPYAFARLLHSFGLKSPIDPVVALCLGPCDASVSEMVSGYSVFANHGIRIEPIYVTRIEDIFGNILETFSPQVSEIINEDACYKMLSMLQGVVDGGTGSRIRRDHKITVSMGGKTGTTQNHSDGWFMGFTPSLVGGAWVGGEDRDIHFDRMSEGQGATMALPIMGIFLQKVYNDPNLGYSQTERFEIPAKYADPCSNQLNNTEDKLTHPSGIDDLFK